MPKRLLLLPVVAVAAVAASVLPAGAAGSIRLKANFFAPKSTTVKKGTTVTFRWTGRAPHNVTVVSGPAKFHSRVQTSGTYKRKLTKKGTYRIVCTIHPGMNLTLKVK